MKIWVSAEGVNGVKSFTLLKSVKLPSEGTNGEAEVVKALASVKSILRSTFLSLNLLILMKTSS